MSKKLLQEALRVALRNNNPRCHPEFYNYIHYTFIVQNGKILEWGTNRQGEPFIKGYSHQSKIHSETDAFRKARGLLDLREEFDVINIRLSKSGELRISKPCPCCHNFLKVMGCKRAWFTTEIGWAKVSL